MNRSMQSTPLPHPSTGPLNVTVAETQPLKIRLGNISRGNSNRVAVYKAAREVRRSPAFVMDLVNQGLIKAYRRGGPANRPWLAVDLSELLAVLDRETLYVPPAMAGRKAPSARVIKTALHPLAAAI